MRIVLAVLGVLVLCAGLYSAGLVFGWFGVVQGPGEPSGASVPRVVLQQRKAVQQRTARAVGISQPKQILFGDLHVHTSYSTDAFLFSLPILGGEGAHPLADACDFSRFCSGLDFWSITDHAEALTPRKWRETRQMIRHCNELGGGQDAPDVIAFLGWEWTQVGRTAATHWGHKNVILHYTDDARVPTRPINAGGFTRAVMSGIPLRVRVGPALLDFRNRQRYYDFDAFARELAETPVCPEGVDVHELPEDCMEVAETPQVLFEKLAQWGLESLVIPHGTTWGFYTPADASWDKQLRAAQHDPSRQTLIEVYSGHGNSEEFRSWEPVHKQADGSLSCPEPRPDYLPSCWRAGEIIETRCREAGLSAAECAAHARRARQLYVEAGQGGRHVVPGERPEDWLDAGQCRDCFLPSFNFRPRSSVQYISALTNFHEPNGPRHFRFGFIASSDNHSARPGTGYKEFARGEMTDQSAPPTRAWSRRLFGETGKPGLEARPFDPTAFQGLGAFQLAEFERQNSFWLTGGLVAVHAEQRTRDGVWNALKRREVYGTSGDRILLWFDLQNPPEGPPRPMGSEVRMPDVPRFQVRAAGAFEQKPGCPDSTTRALSAQRIAALCKGECYNPSNRRKRITRIEIVRILPQVRPGEPVETLIQDPWRVLPCPADPDGCTVEFEDPDFPALGRDALYYVRAIEAPSPAVNADNLRCSYDENGSCVSVDPCFGDWRTPASDRCLGEAEERAWSSPIYVDAPLAQQDLALAPRAPHSR